MYWTYEAMMVRPQQEDAKMRLSSLSYICLHVITREQVKVLSWTDTGTSILKSVGSTFLQRNSDVAVKYVTQKHYFEKKWRHTSTLFPNSRTTFTADKTMQKRKTAFDSPSLEGDDYVTNGFVYWLLQLIEFMITYPANSYRSQVDSLRHILLYATWWWSYCRNMLWQ
jgi:hypothetical protein